MLTTDLITAALKDLTPTAKVYVAYSGGVDSHVLLHLCAAIPTLRPRLTAVYVHHGLQTAADAWAVHGEKISQQLGVAFICLRVDAKAATGVSPEEAARNARYQAFATLLNRYDVLLLAQHQDDQLETVLLQLFRGAGLQGLAGMPIIAPLGLGHSIRPLLSVSRQAIVNFAKQQQLSWIEDPSNQSNAFDRNLLRNAVLPILTRRWPMLATTVARSAKHCAEAHDTLQSQTQSALAMVLDVNSGTIALAKLASYPPYQQRLIIRHWLQTQGLKMPSEALLSAIFEQVIAASQSRDPELIYQQVGIRRFRNQLYCIPLNTATAHPAQQPMLWPTEQSCFVLPTGYQLQLVAAEQGINRDLWQAAEVSIRFRAGGEKIALKGRTGRQALKKLYQEALIPPWQRANMPLIYLNGQLAAVADRWISRDCWTDDSTKALRLIWCYTENTI